VNVPGNVLPSTGLDPSRYRFHSRTENPAPGLKPPIASFAPEFNDAQVGVIGHEI
jgi:hypothetical protein